MAGGLNLYGFAGGDPVNFSDPFGLDCRDREGRPKSCAPWLLLLNLLALAELGPRSHPGQGQLTLPVLQTGQQQEFLGMTFTATQPLFMSGGITDDGNYQIGFHGGVHIKIPQIDKDFEVQEATFDLGTGEFSMQGNNYLGTIGLTIIGNLHEGEASVSVVFRPSGAVWYRGIFDLGPILQPSGAR